jgi:PAS domain-containing protein
MWRVGKAKDYNEEPATLESKEKKELKAPDEKLCNKTHAHDYGNGLLKDDSHFIKKILDTMVNPVSYKDRNGVFREVNQAYVTRVAGIPREEIIGKTLIEVSKKIYDKLSGKVAIQEKSLPVSCIEWVQQDTEVMKTGKTRTDEQEFILADGTKTTFIVNKSPLRDEKGEIIGIVTLMQDITELRRKKKP